MFNENVQVESTDSGESLISWRTAWTLYLYCAGAHNMPQGHPRRTFPNFFGVEGIDRRSPIGRLNRRKTCITAGGVAILQVVLSPRLRQKRAAYTGRQRKCDEGKTVGRRVVQLEGTMCTLHMIIIISAPILMDAVSMTAPTNKFTRWQPAGRSSDGALGALL